MGHIILPGQEHQMRMSLSALFKVAKFILKDGINMKEGDTFTIEGTDKKKLIIKLDK